MLQSREKYVPIQYVPQTSPAPTLRMLSRYLPGGAMEIDPYEVKSMLRDAYVDLKPRYGYLMRNCEYTDPVEVPAEYKVDEGLQQLVILAAELGIEILAAEDCEAVRAVIVDAVTSPVEVPVVVEPEVEAEDDDAKPTTKKKSR